MIKVSSQHKAEQINSCFTNFMVCLSENSTGGGHAATKLWRAKVDPFEQWNKYEQEWVTSTHPIAEGTTPSKAIEGLWNLLTTGGVHKSLEGGYVWVFRANMGRFQTMDPGEADYPNVKDNSFLSTMEWPPKNWHFPTEPQEPDSNWSVSKGQYTKVDGKKVKVKHLKMMIHELSLYYENDIEPTGDAKNQADQLKTQGFYYMTEAEVAKEKKIKEANKAYLAKKHVMNATIGVQNMTTNMDAVDKLIKDQMQKWATNGQIL